MKNSCPKRKRVCRLCLLECDDFELIKGDKKDDLHLLLHETNFFVSEEPVICTNCAEMVKKYSDLRARCFHVHTCTVSFKNDNTNTRMDLKDVYLKKIDNAGGIPENHKICGFCLNLVKNSSATSLDNEEGNDMPQKMMEICFPEVDLSIIEKPIICSPCHESLEGCFHFMTNFLIVEEKIKKYCESLNIINEKCVIDLARVLEFTLRNILSKDDITVDLVKEEKFCLDPENVEKLLEDKNENFLGWGDQEFDNILFTSKDILNCKEEDDKADIFKSEVNFYVQQVNEVAQQNEDFAETDQKSLHNRDTEIKMDQQDFKRFQDVTEPCSNHIFTDKNVSQGTNDDCTLEIHNSDKDNSETPMYHCASCPWQTKYKSNLKTHMLVHRKPSQLTMYHCKSCPFQTKRKNSVLNHMLTHQNQSESTIYRCESCPFQTKHRHSLKRHFVIHKDPSEVTMYQCDLCSYRTKYKYVIERHNSVHRSPAEDTVVYQCDSCSYQTKKKGALKLHSIVHKDSSELPVHNCESCAFETMYKRCLQRHITLKHEKLPLSKYVLDRPVYQCGSCSYETVKEVALKVHALVHKDPSEVSMHKCDSCAFETKYKRCLQRHDKLRHRKLTMDKCVLERHNLINRNPSEGPVYQCDSCSYLTTKKKAFKLHGLVHKDPKEISMYRCGTCLFETKYKRCLRRHIILKHRKWVEEVDTIQSGQSVNVGENDTVS